MNLYMFGILLLKKKVSTSYGYNIGSGPKKLDGLRLLKEFLYEVIGKNEFGEDIYVLKDFLIIKQFLNLKSLMLKVTLTVYLVLYF